MVFRHLIVHGGLRPGAAVGGVVLHDGAVHPLHHVFDEFRAKVIAVGRFAGGQLYRHLARGGPPQRLIDRHHGLRGDIGEVVDRGTGLGLMLQGGQGDDLPAVGGNGCSIGRSEPGTGRGNGGVGSVGDWGGRVGTLSLPAGGRKRQQQRGRCQQSG